MAGPAECGGTEGGKVTVDGKSPDRSDDTGGARRGVVASPAAGRLRAGVSAGGASVDRGGAARATGGNQGKRRRVGAVYSTSAESASTTARDRPGRCGLRCRGRG